MASREVQVSSGLRQLFSKLREDKSAAKHTDKLYAAVDDNDVSLVRQLLAEDQTQVDKPNLFGETPLYVAARKGNDNIVSALLASGARVKRRTDIRDDNDEDIDDWKSPLHVAATRTIVEMLLREGVDINDRNDHGQTALHTSIRQQLFEVAELLIQKGIRVNDASDEGVTPLHEACDGSCDDSTADIIQLLLTNGADINGRTFSGQTPLHCACGIMHPLTIIRELLSNGARMDISDNKGDYPIHECANKFHLHEDEDKSELITLLLTPEYGTLKDSKGRTVLHIAAESSSKSIVEIITKQCGCINESDNFGRTPLHYAALNKDNTGVIMCLVTNDAMVNAVDVWGQTALHYAVSIGNIDGIVNLLESNAGVNLKDVTGVAPLHVACLNNSIISIEHLLSNAADVTSLDNNRSSPLHFAAWNDNTIEDILTLMLDRGADITQHDVLGQTCLDIAIFRRNTGLHSILMNHIGVSETESTKQHINELSNVANKLMKSDKVVELIISEKGLQRSIPDARGFVSELLTFPGLGRGTDEYEAREIQLAIEGMMQTLAERIGHLDPRFKCVVLHAGSTSEGTKTRFPDEFDFMFCLEEFSKHCDPIFLNADTANSKKLNIPMEAKPELHTQDEIVSISDYVQMMIKTTPESEPYLKCSCSTTMTCFKMSFGFTELLTKALFSPTFPVHQRLMPMELTTDPALTLRWRGSRYKHLDIVIDIVPAILLPNWPEKTRKDLTLLTSDMLRLPCVAVPKTTARGDADLWRCSVALTETAIFRQLRAQIRNSYIACKAFVTSNILPAIDFETYETEKLFYKLTHGSMSSEDEIQMFEHAENLIPSYILKMSFLSAVEERAKRDGLGSVYLPQSQDCMDGDKSELDTTLGISSEAYTSHSDKCEALPILGVEDHPTTYYGPATTMNVAERCVEFDLELVQEVFRRCDEGVTNKFVPSVFNLKHNVLGYELMSGGVEKVELFIKIIRKLLD